MSEPVFSCITLRALLRLYQIHLRPLPDGRWIGRHPLGARPGSALYLDAEGASWTTNDKTPIGGDRLDFIARMECVSRERAAELLHGTFPAVLEREGIPESGVGELLRDRPGSAGLCRDKSGFARLCRDKSGFAGLCQDRSGFGELRRDKEGV